ncbi:MAG: hypothetical protein M3N07_03450 [Pseudomonadota bacterium]|nr:hypothetical protein [Pseudomonadota bacterium]
MSYTKLERQPPLRDKALAHEERGPGLYDDGEVAVRLDSGHYVAASVSWRVLDNGGGVAFEACARWIHGDGATRLDRHGQHVKRSLTYNVPAPRVAELGLQAIAREMLHAVLGEPPTMRALGDGSGETLPLIPWSDESRLNANIRQAIALTAETAPRMDAAALLGL